MQTSDVRKLSDRIDFFLYRIFQYGYEARDGTSATERWEAVRMEGERYPWTLQSSYPCHNKRDQFDVGEATKLIASDETLFSRGALAFPCKRKRISLSSTSARRCLQSFKSPGTRV